MRIIQFLIFITIIYGCKFKKGAGTESSKNKANTINQIEKVRTSKKTLQESIDSFSFLKDYKEEIDFDTTIVGGNNIHIHLSHGITGSHFVLPSELIFDDDSIEKLIFRTKTVISFQNSNINVDDSSVIEVISNQDEQLKKMGVLLLSGEQIRLDRDTLVLPYSYSIPYTDLGKSINVKIDIQSKRFIVE